ncbi:MAG TPA: helix-turn-helix transcriptional regulator [Verrucomicrobiae bacterium]
MAVSLPQHRKKLGEAVRKYRKEAEFSQEKLAEKASLSTVFISDVERGVENISVDALARIAKAVGINLRDLFE